MPLLSPFLSRSARLISQWASAANLAGAPASPEPVWSDAVNQSSVHPSSVDAAARSQVRENRVLGNGKTSSRETSKREISKREIRAACQSPGCLAGAHAPGFWNAKPVCRFENLSLCSRDCLGRAVTVALRRELLGAEQTEQPYSHRIPLGLLMLSRRWVTREQLAGALASQKAAGQGKLGEWLVRTEGVDEQLVANALAMQWGVPLLALDAAHDARTSHLLPCLFIQALDVVPLRVAAGKILYLAVNERVDRCLNATLEAMTGLTVEAGVMKQSAYARVREAAVAGARPARLFSCPTVASLERSITDQVSDSGAVWSRLARVKGYLWLRMETVEAARAGGQIGVAEIRDAIFTLPQATW